MSRNPRLLWEVRLPSGTTATAYLLPTPAGCALVWHLDSRLRDVLELASREDAEAEGERVRRELLKVRNRP